jgi:hypothetical protein
MKNKVFAIYLAFICQCAGLNNCQAQVRQEEASLQVTPVITHLLIDSIRAALNRYKSPYYRSERQWWR